MTLKSFENWTLGQTRLIFPRINGPSTFLSLVFEKNTANGKEACQDDRVQVCLLSYLSNELLIFPQAKHLESLPVDFRLLNFVLR